MSASGGTAPRWRQDGKEIFYVAQRKLMALSAAAYPTLSPGAPQVLFEKGLLQAGYDVDAGGKRFVVLDKPAGEPPLAVHVVHNWFEEFRGNKSGQGK